MVRLVVHTATVATNALIEGKTARVGMITTQGFRDELEIGRQIRSRLYDVHLTKPRPLVSRRWSFEVRERLDAEGKVLEPWTPKPCARQCGSSKLKTSRPLSVVFSTPTSIRRTNVWRQTSSGWNIPKPFCRSPPIAGFPIPFGMTLRMRECSLPARGCDKMYPALGPLDTFQRPLYAPQARQTQSNRGGGRRCTSG